MSIASLQEKRIQSRNFSMCQRIHTSLVQSVSANSLFLPSLRIPEGGVHCFSESIIDPIMAIGTSGGENGFPTLKLIRPHRKLRESELKSRTEIEDVEDPQYNIGDYFTIYEKSKYHRNIITDLDFSKNFLFTGSEDQTVTMFDCSQMLEIRGSFLGTTPHRIKYWEDERGLLCCTNQGLIHWDTRTINSNAMCGENTDSTSDSAIPFMNDFSMIGNHHIIIGSKYDGLQLRDLRKINEVIFTINDDYMSQNGFFSEYSEISNFHDKEIRSVSTNGRTEILFSTSQGSLYYVPDINIIPYSSTTPLKTSKLPIILIHQSLPTIKVFRKRFNTKKRLLDLKNQFVSFCGWKKECVLMNDQNNRVFMFSKSDGLLVKDFREVPTNNEFLSMTCCGEFPDVLAFGTHREVLVFKNMKLMNRELGSGVKSPNNDKKKISLTNDLSTTTTTTTEGRNENRMKDENSGGNNNNNNFSITTTTSRQLPQQRSNNSGHNHNNTPLSSSSANTPIVEIDFGGNFGEEMFQPEWSSPVIEQDKYKCQYQYGYIEQQVSICLTCMANNNNNNGGVGSDSTTGNGENEFGTGFCRQCEQFCHSSQGHITARIGKKSLFRCDCGCRSVCYCELKKTQENQRNTSNKYNDNFKNMFCFCKSATGVDDDNFMFQCVKCEDWFHERCILLRIPNLVNNPPIDNLIDPNLRERIREGFNIHLVCENCRELDPSLVDLGRGLNNNQGREGRRREGQEEEEFEEEEEEGRVRIQINNENNDNNNNNNERIIWRRVGGESVELMFRAERGSFLFGNLDVILRSPVEEDDEFQRVCQEVVSATPSTPRMGENMFVKFDNVPNNMVTSNSNYNTSQSSSSNQNRGKEDDDDEEEEEEEDIIIRFSEGGNDGNNLDNLPIGERRRVEDEDEDDVDILESDDDEDGDVMEDEYDDDGFVV